MPIANWDDVKRKLDQLRELDRHLAGFGSPKHGYLSHPLAESEVEALESDLGVRLPDDFRGFLREVGCGAGPYYGIYTPRQILDEVRDGLDTWMEDCEPLHQAWIASVKAAGEWPRPFIPRWAEWVSKGWPDFAETSGGWPTPDRPFPFTRAQAETIPQGLAWQKVLETPYPAPGCILIEHQGCNYYTVLVTAGELAGSVWDFLAGDNVWLPARCTSQNFYRAPAHLPLVPTFREWYTGWLDASLKDFPTHEQDEADARARIAARLKERGLRQ